MLDPCFTIKNYKLKNCGRGFGARRKKRRRKEKERSRQGTWEKGRKGDTQKDNEREAES